MSTSQTYLPRAATLVELLRRAADEQPNEQLYSFLSSGDTADQSLSYAELDRRARAVAALLQQLDAAGERVLLLYPPGLEYIVAFFGCLYAGAIAVPAYPPQLNRPAPRLQAIVADAQATIALTNGQILANMEQRFAHAPDLAALRWLSLDGLDRDLTQRWQPAALSTETLAFLQYTSGSTSTPKGVMLTHGNLLYNLSQIERCFGHSTASRGVIWLPPYHDMGLIGGVLQPLYAGFPVTLMAPVAFLQRPFRWLQAISETRATTSGGPNFAYELAARKVTPEQRATLDLSSWRVAFTGAEPIRPETLDLFAATFAECGFRREAFYPCYGLAEATLIVSGGELAAPPIVRHFHGLALGQNLAVAADANQEGSRGLVGCGQNLPQQQIVIANPETLAQARPGEIGEIWVASPSVAQGYWQQPEATERTFGARLSDTSAGPFLRTGDLGFVQDGELFITGRLKDLIIIRGRNHYPQDIELTVEQSYPGLRPGCGAAFAIERDGEERLVVVQELERRAKNADIAELAAAIRQQVAAQHDLQVYGVVLIKAGTIPKTSSGKIQRHACRVKFEDGTLDLIGQSVLDATIVAASEPALLSREALEALSQEERRAALERYLREQIAHALRIEATRLDADQSVSALGLDSLAAVELVNRIELDLGVVVPMVALLQGHTIPQIAAEILAQLSAAPDEILPTPIDPETDYPLSYGQRALWFLYQLAPDSSAYNIASAARIRSQLDATALRRAFQTLVERHAGLRTIVVVRDGEPMQRILPQAEIALALTDAAAWDDAELHERLAEAANRPFDLQSGPLLRVQVFSRAPDEHVLLLAIHHIVADFWSLAVLIHELGQLYTTDQGESIVALPEPELRYTDYARWQAALLSGAEGERLWSYWREQLRGAETILNLPTDRPRPATQTFHGASHAFLLEPELGRRLAAWSEARGLTLYMTLLAAWQALLFRYTGQHDLLVGSTTAGRSRARLAGLVGYFVNPIVLRANCTGNPSFAAFAEQVRETVLAAFAHQEYPFPLLVERLQPERDPSRSPLFQVMFSFQQTPLLDREGLAAFALGETGARLSLGELQVESVALEQRSAQFDLTLAIAPTAEGLGGSLQYNSDLFAATTIARMAGHFTLLLQSIVEQPEQRIADLPLLTAAEQQMLATWNATEASYPQDLCLHQLFEAQAERTPDAIAVVADDGQLSYRELDQRANQLARHLRSIGVGPDSLVGIFVERGLSVLVGVLGILKAGGAYIPLDPAYPAERIQFMLHDARVPVLLTQQKLAQSLPPHAAQVIRLDADWPQIGQQPVTAPNSGVLPDHLAYIIYTSGSTGKPKGVQIPHRAVVNFLESMRRQPGLSEHDVLLSVTTLSFDIAALELFLPLTTGARIELASRELAADGTRLLARMRDSGVTVMQATPATWRLLIEAGWQGGQPLKALCGGEALPPELARQILQRGATLWNMYGPTETTIWSAVAEVTASQPIAIGHPIANTRIYLLNSRLQPVPVGVPGELYIGGDGLARGYLHQPALTAERFIPDPLARPEDHRPGARLYWTGDLARYLPDGRIEYLGRIDHQVKLRGYRIELGEIEAVLRQHPAVSGAVVLVRQDVPPASGPPDMRIVAYVTGEQGNKGTQEQRDDEALRTTHYTPGSTADFTLPVPKATTAEAPGESRAADLRAFLREHLPEYMIPSAFVTLPAFPLTPNGKIDRKALPAPAALDSQRAASYVAPRSQTEQLIARVWQEVLHLEQVGLHDNFFDLGGHSLLLAQAHSKLRAALNVNLSLVDLFRYPTISALAGYLSQEQDANAAPQQAIERARQRRAASAQQSTAIAIVGMHGRFPGAATIDEFWDNLRSGVNAISFFSDEELSAAGVAPELLRDPSYVKARGILDNIDSFDANFFGINPREAQVMDPQHRIFLESAWHALEHAGYDSARYPGRIGVFAGVGINTYLLYASRASMEVAGRYQAFIGNDKDFVPTRVSYKLNLRGPSVNVQTACSSSLVAVHLACQSLLQGEADMALAGGITISVPHKSGYFYEPGGIPSPDGYCRAFDADAQGTVFGNGVGIVVLKRLQDALQDGDTIHAVIKGSAINNDGANKIGYTAPSVDGQAEVIAEALSIAGVTPDTIDYIETHGTGTPLGDPIEIAALNHAFGSGIAAGSCRIGSVKPSIGHLDTAAGVAGLIKTVLALKHQQIPPSLHYSTPNPKIDFASSPFSVNTALSDWQGNGHPRRAGVSSFGIGGTNAHLILEEAPRQEAQPPRRPWQLLLLSARSDAALDAATANLSRFLLAQPELNLADVAYTLQVGRAAFDHRRVLVCRDPADAAAALATIDPERVFSGVSQPGQRPVIFMFPGQGAQYIGMGRDLYRSEPVFRAAIDRCCELLRPHLHPAGTRDLRELLYPDAEHSDAADEQLTQTAYAQPALFAVAYALAQLWQSWGVEPTALIGHSIGEYVAATLAGVFALDDALAIVALRGRLMQALPSGSMLAVQLSEADLQPFLRPELDLAAVNGPKHCVVSGPTAAIAALEARLSEREITSRRLHTSHAFHSAMLDPMLDEFAAALGSIKLHPPKLPYISNLSGTWISEAEATDPGYWTRQIRQPVRFADGLQTLLADRDAALLEVGPGTTLCTFARQQSRQPLALPSLRHPQSRQADDEFLLTTLGKLWLGGVDVDWQRLYPDEQRRRVPLPLYPFERQRYWIDAEPPAQQPKAAAAPAGKRSDIADWFYAPLWKQSLPPAPFDPQRPDGAAERWLLFADGCGLGRQMAQRLREAGQDVVTVAIGAGFSQHDTAAYSIDPADRDDYDRLLAALRDANRLPTRIAHLWSVTNTEQLATEGQRLEQAQAHGFYSLLYLAQALEKQRVAEPLRIGIFSNNMQKIAGEQALYPEKATLLGPCKVLPQEYPHLSCQSIDLVLPRPGSDDEADLIDQLLGELHVSSQEQVIAYRGLDRWTQTFEPLRLDGSARAATRLQAGGVYLITGGLGGIGLVLAEHLARNFQARLVLTGRSALPERNHWADWLAAHGENDATSRRIRSVQRLEALGAEVLIVSADVTDSAQMRSAIEQAHERFGAIHGVIHAAGVAGGGMAQLKTLAIAAPVLAPKVQGTLVLYQLLKEIRPSFLLLCSSINAVIGGFGQSDYCAANAFMDAFAASHSSRRGTLIAAINWDRWLETGMAVTTDVPSGFRELQRGYREQGAHPLLGRLVSDTPEKIVYLGALHGSRDWVLAEHKIVGSPTVPGTTYLEMVRAAFEKAAHDGLTEIRDVIFIAPLIVGDTETRELLTVLERQSDGYEFRVFSRAGHEQQSDNWQEHVKGLVRRVPFTPALHLDLHHIAARCNRSTLSFSADQREDNGGFLEAGPRWRNLKTVQLGDGEGLATLELDEDFAADLDTFKLHPALLDVATGSVQRLGKGNYLPLTYQSLQIRQPLPRKVWSYVRQQDAGSGPQEILTCDISLLDEFGVELVAIQAFSMKRVGDEAIALLKEQARRVEPAATNGAVTNGAAKDDGILSHEGAIAFERILAGSVLPQIVVSVKDLHAVIDEANAFTTAQILENFEQLALPQLVQSRPQIASAYIAPGSDLESQIAGIWQRVLGIDQIGVHDNFFELGGTSLSGIQIISELKKELGVEVPTVSIFEAPTVSALAKLLRPDQSEQATFQQARSRAERKLGRKRR
jgi:amino acid adenylation domain-containing protein